LPPPGLDVTGGHWPPAPLNAFRASARNGLDVAGPRCRRWPFATCATRYLPYGHLPAAVQAGLGGPRWAIDISNTSNPLLTKPSISLFLAATYLQHFHDQEVCSPPPEIAAGCLESSLYVYTGRQGLVRGLGERLSSLRALGEPSSPNHHLRTPNALTSSRQQGCGISVPRPSTASLCDTGSYSVKVANCQNNGRPEMTDQRQHVRR